MKRILLFILLVGNISCFAQFKDFSIQVGPNYTLIGDVSQTFTVTQEFILTGSTSSYTKTTGSIRTRFDALMGVDAGGSFNYELPGRFFLTSGLTIHYLRFKQRVSVESISHTQTSSSTPDDALGKTSAWYLQMPVMAGTAFWNNKLVVRTGLTASAVLNARQYQQHYAIDYSTSVPVEKVTVSPGNVTGNFTTLSIGAVLQGTYCITPNIGVDLTAQRSFSNIYKSEIQAGAKYNTLSLGMRYTF